MLLYAHKRRCYFTKLNINFDEKLEPTINLYQPLADWFERNQEVMAYFELIHERCSENVYGSIDLRTLAKMADAGLTWLEASNITPEEKAINAAVSMASVYNEMKEWLSDTAKTLYYIDVKESQKDDDQVKKIIH